MLLRVKDLKAETELGKVILNNFNLEIGAGEIHVIMGPNGSGKSTLSKVIMGHPDYVVTKGDILFEEESLLELETDERSRKGLFLTMQAPIHVEGVTNSEFLKTAINARREEKIDLFEFIEKVDKSVNDLDMDSEMIHRAINKDFSGGERKKNEILQLKMLEPKFIMLDELDSGLDVDSLRIVTENINNYLKESPDTSVLIITHYPKILEYIKPKFVHILKGGKIIKNGDYSLAKEIDEKGYRDFED